MTCDRWTDDDDLDCYLECRYLRLRSEFERTADVSVIEWWWGAR